MRDESSPFFDPALRGFGAGLVGALAALAIYYVRNASQLHGWEDGGQLAVEVASFAAVMSGVLAGATGALRRRIGFSRALILVCSLIGPVAASFASWRFGSYPIPMVDAFVVGGGLGATFLLLAKILRPDTPFLRLALRMAVVAAPIALVAALVLHLLAPWASNHYGELMAIGPVILGGAGGSVLGPTCGLWLAAALGPLEAGTSHRSQTDD